MYLKYDGIRDGGDTRDDLHFAVFESNSKYYVRINDWDGELHTQTMYSFNTFPEAQEYAYGYIDATREYRI